MDEKGEKIAIDVWSKFNHGYNMQKSERPDWVDHDKQIGVEVVSSEPTDVCKQIDYYLKNHGNVSQKGLERMKRSDCSVVTAQTPDGPVTCFFRAFGEEEKESLINEIKKKLQKTGYQKLKKIDLFVFARQFPRGSFSEADFNCILNCENECAESRTLHFDKIFLDFYERIAILDMNEHSYEEFDYTE